MKKTILIYFLFCTLLFALFRQETFSYEEKINVPVCERSNPYIFFIESAADWKMINDVDKKVFCIKAGDYSRLGHVVLETNGSKEVKRYIILDDSSSKHPAQLEDRLLAKVGLKFNNSHFWVIDRISYGESNNTFIPFVLHNSDNNIFNRCFIKDVKGGGIVFYSGSDNNTIQNSRFERTKVFNYMDRAAIELNNHGEDYISIKDNQIISNEIVNYVDGIQVVKTGLANQRYINCEGTKIINNHIYIDDSIYTDCHGKLDRRGDCAYAENAIDLKAGSENAKNPLIISGNKMWGYRKSDQYDYTKDKNNSTLRDQGVIIPIHFNVKNVIFSNNIFFDSFIAMVMDGTRHGYSAQGIQIKNNLFYNIYATAIYATETKDISIENNSFNKISYGLKGKGEGTYSAIYFNNSEKIVYRYNTVIDAYRNIKFYVPMEKYKVQLDNPYTFEGNKWFNAKFAKGENKYAKSMAIKIEKDYEFKIKNPFVTYENLEFRTDRFTGMPKDIVLPRVLN